MYVFYIHGIKCATCAGKLEQFLRGKSVKLKGFSVDVTTAAPKPKVTTVILEEEEGEHQENWEKLKKIIEEYGYRCEHYEYPLPKEVSVKTPPAKNRFLSLLKKTGNIALNIITSPWLLGALGCIAGIALLIVSLFATGGLPLSVLIPIACFSTLFTLILGARSYYDALYKLIKTRTLTMDALFTISTLTVLSVSITAFFVPGFPMMFEASLLILGFRQIGVAIEETIKEKISSAKFQDRAPQFVQLYLQNTLKKTRLSEVKPGDFICVKPGDIIPIDGICENETNICTKIITGATFPQRYPQGATVLAGMRLAENASPLKIRVTKPASLSYLARLDEGISKSILEKAPIEIKTAQLLSWFIIAIIAAAILSGVIVGIFFPPAVAIQCFVSVIVCACPCVLGLIIPLAVKVGMHKAAENGVRFKNTKILQQFTEIDTVVCDLHGTLTTGVPEISRAAAYRNTGVSAIQLLGICAALEKASLHPIGREIYSFARQHNTDQLSTSNIDASHHSGVVGHINGTKFSIGSFNLMQEQGISIKTQPRLAPDESIVFIAREKTIIGCVIYKVPLRKDAEKTIKALIDKEIDVRLCTGASEASALYYAGKLGIKARNVRANCVATSINQQHNSKTAYIRELRRKGKTIAMMGDAANDAAAMAESDVGIAIISRDSDELTQQHAGVIIHSDSLLPVVSAFEVSRQTNNNIMQNLAMSLLYNLTIVLIAGGILAAVGFTLHPGVGVALMVLQACVVLLNVYRFKQQALSHLQQEKPKPISSSHTKINNLIPKYSNNLNFEPDNSYHAVNKERPPEFIPVERLQKNIPEEWAGEQNTCSLSI